MKTKSFWLMVAVGSIAIGSTFSIQTPSDAAPKTTFACIRDGEAYATIAIRGDRQTSPMITWKETSYGANYTPEKRCKIVSQRLTKAVATSTTLSSLTMNYGIVNSIPVICFITRKSDKCNAKNVLFSLKAADRGQEQKILSDLLSFSRKGSGSSIEESTGKTINFEDWIEQNLTTPEDPGASSDLNPLDLPNQK